MIDLDEIPDLDEDDLDEDEDEDERGFLDEVDVFVLLEDLDDEVVVEDFLVVEMGFMDVVVGGRVVLLGDLDVVDDLGWLEDLLEIVTNVFRLLDDLETKLLVAFLEVVEDDFTVDALVECNKELVDFEDFGFFELNTVEEETVEVESSGSSGLSGSERVDVEVLGCGVE